MHRPAPFATITCNVQNTARLSCFANRNRYILRLDNPKGASGMNQKTPRAQPPNAREFASYAREMLLSLKKMASERRQETLVVLLDAAAAEALAIAAVEEVD